MHELALAQGVLDIVLDVARDEPVRLVRVRVGELQRVLPESLRFCFQLVAQDSPAAQAELVIDEVPGDDMRVTAVETR
jgi:hydrogenase nickel incorporation protein HypA/HybF